MCDNTLSIATTLITGFVPDRGELEGPVAQQRRPRARDVKVPGSYLVSNYWGPNTPFIFLVASIPLIIIPYQQVPSPMFVPKRSWRGVVGSRAVTTLSLLLESLPN